MIPIFPVSKKLELTDKEELESYTKGFAPYSDYNFVSMFSYNTQNSIELSYLNDNLVVLFEDYITGEPVYTFLGTNNLEDTTRQLFKSADLKNIIKLLKLIPEGNFGNGEKSIQGFEVTEDPDNFDYILSLEKISNLVGGEFQDKRNLRNRFHRENPDAEFRSLSLSDENIHKEIVQVFDVWAENKHKPIEETNHEKIAIQRLLTASPSFNLITIGIYDKNKLISFAISEKLDNQFSISHFAKANIKYKGIFEATNNALAKKLLETNCIYLNYEQDIGIENLKKSKELWRPVDYLKKYIISPLA